MKRKILELQNITVGYDQKDILSHLSSSLEEKTVVALMGENGVGKSCLLKSISGLIPLKSGTILLNTKKLEAYTATEMAQTLSVVLTEKFQIDFLKVGELVALGRSPYLNKRGTLTTHDLQEVDDVLGLMNIKIIKDRYFAELSDGQKQKVLIARALAQNPKLLILDEPTTYLDIPSRKELMSILRKIVNEKEIAILYSSHDADLACEFADDAWFIDRTGKLSVIPPASAKSIFSKLE